MFGLMCTTRVRVIVHRFGRYSLLGSGPHSTLLGSLFQHFEEEGAFGADYVENIILSERRRRREEQRTPLNIQRKDLAEIRPPRAVARPLQPPPGGRGPRWGPLGGAGMKKSSNPSREHRIRENLKQLRLLKIAEIFPEFTRQAAQAEMSHLEYLDHLIAQEAAWRHERMVKYRIAAARLPFPKSIQDYDFSWPSRINKQKILDLLELGFIERKANAVFIGPTGVGKTHLLWKPPRQPSASGAVVPAAGMADSLAHDHGAC